jgi:hypothetical protein
MAIKLGTDGVQAAVADEQAVSKLTTTMGNLGLAHDVTPVLAMIDTLQREAGISEDVLRPAFSRLVTTLGDSSKAMDALKLSMDISIATGKPLETVVAALGKAYDGNTGALGKLGVGLDKTILKTGDMDTITGILADRFGGSATKNAQTYQGQIDKLTIGFGELQESFGTGFLSGLTSAEGGLSSLTTFMADNEGTVETFGQTVGEVATDILEVAKMAADAKKAIDNWTKGMGPAGEIIDGFVSTLSGGLIPILMSAGNAAKWAADQIERLIGLQIQANGNYTGPSNPSSLAAAAAGATKSIDPIAASKSITTINSKALARTGN